MRLMNKVGAVSVLGLSGLASPALAQGGQVNEYLISWCVTTWTSRTAGVDLQAQIDLTGTTIRRDSVILYENAFGKFPYGGPHLSENPAWMREHIAKIAVDLNRLIPDPNFNGYAVIDYETWFPDWSRLDNSTSNMGAEARDHDFKDDWEEYLRIFRPQVLRGLTGEAKERALAATFNAASQKLYLETLREGKRLRPRAKWGFYGFPAREYYVDYAPRRDAWRALNTTNMSWMHDAVDALFPSLYAVAITVEDREPRRGTMENTPAQNAAYIIENVRETVRISRGKPVLPFIHFRYHPNVGPAMEGKWITDLGMRQQLELPKQAGAKGVIIWDCIESERHFRELRDIMLTKIAPRADAVAVIPTNNNGGTRSRNTSTVTRLPNGRVIVNPSRIASGGNGN